MICLPYTEALFASAIYPTCDQCGVELEYVEAHDGDGLCSVCRKENDPVTGYRSDEELDADAAHVAKLVECGDLCGLTVFGTPFKFLEQQ